MPTRRRVFALWLWLFPRRYLPDMDADLSAFDVDFDWTLRYGWGFFAADPVQTWIRGAGGCLDHARLCASVLYHRDDRPLWFVLAVRVAWPPGHLLVFDGEKTYSSTGGITRETLAEYKARTDRLLMVRRTIRAPSLR